MSSVLPDSILKRVSEKVAKRFTNRAVQRRCDVQRLAAYTEESRARHNVSGVKPVVWTCTDRECEVGLGDQFRGVASAFYQSVAVGYDMIANWSWPAPIIPDILRPSNATTWQRAEEAAQRIFRENSSVYRISWDDRLGGGQLCNWTKYAAVEFKSTHNYKPTGTKDCDFNMPSISMFVSKTSWSKTGIGCAFWQKFRIGAELERALNTALDAFDLWKRKHNRTHLPTIAVHVRGGDRHFGIDANTSTRIGIENPFVARVRKTFNRTLAHELLRCARDNEQSLRLKNATYFVLADNAQAKAEAELLFPGRVYSSPVVPVHSGISFNDSSNAPGTKRNLRLREKSRSEHIGIWVDLMMASLCESLVMSPSPNAGFWHSTFGLVSGEVGMYHQGRSSSMLIDGRKCIDVKLKKKGVFCRRGRYDC